MKRKLLIAVRKAFKENNIELPATTVHEQKGEESAPAAAQALTARRKRGTWQRPPRTRPKVKV